MCGICGIYNFDNKKVKVSSIDLMNKAMISRGPDSAGTFVQNNFGFGMRRLSIIDVLGGNQPMFSNDKKVSIIYNGEIYNYVELKRDLEIKGVSFKTSSDTEVILKLYEKFGENFIDKIRGMFSICIYDKSKNKIIIFRDRFGIKPLYYFYNSKTFIFSSSLNSISEILQNNIRESRDNFVLYCLFNFFPNNKTVYDKTFKLKPGHKLVIENNQLNISQYWKPSISEKKIKFSDLKELIYEKLIDTTFISLRSDVKIATLLSSGIDSSILSYLISLNLDEQITLSMNYAGKIQNEAERAKKYSQYIKSDHYSFSLEDRTFFTYFNEIFSKIDEPNADTALISSYFLSKEASKLGIKVLVSGAGADEIFGGYSRFFKSINNNLYGALGSNKNLEFLHKLMPYKLQNIYYKFANSKIALASNYSGQNFGVLNDLLIKQHKEFFYHTLEEILLDYKDGFLKFNPKKVMLNDILNYLPDNILSAFDKATMLNSIEGRVPYLDHPLAETLLSNDLGKNYFDSFSNNKRLLREIFKSKIPDYIFNQNKIGFDAPLKNWRKLNAKYFIENDINEFLYKNMQINKLKKNINNENFTQLTYSLNCYNKWLNSKNVLLSNNTNI